jgi:haloacetate dehalogenase
MAFFPGFKRIRVATSGAQIHGVVAGNGPPLLLLQGWPQTHIEWRHVAPELAKHFTVVATDLRGYGDSSKPPGGENHSGYSKRAMAQDQVEVMRHLGFDRFALAGHDRGGRVACRLALDHPQAVSRLALLDIVPTRTLYTQVTRELATWYFHWFFLIQPAPLPELLLAGQAEQFLRNFPFRGLIPNAIDDEAFAHYLRCFSDPQTLHAMCEDYRAGASIDLQHDEADLDAQLRCPTLVLWGMHGAMHRLFDVLETWRTRAPDLQGKALPAGHWLPEECPQELTEALAEFFTRAEARPT